MWEHHCGNRNIIYGMVCIWNVEFVSQALAILTHRINYIHKLYPRGGKSTANDHARHNCPSNPHTIPLVRRLSDPAPLVHKHSDPTLRGSESLLPPASPKTQLTPASPKTQRLFASP